MQLTRHTDYAFRSLMFMATMRQEYTTISAISSTFSMPKSHLMKVINKLATHQYVHTVRGKNGGIKLAKAPADITLMEIVQLMEKILQPFDCEGQSCLILNVCQLKHTFLGAQQHYLDYLEQHTIEDMINQKTIETIHQKDKRMEVTLS